MAFIKAYILQIFSPYTLYTYPFRFLSLVTFLFSSLYSGYHNCELFWNCVFSLPTSCYTKPVAVFIEPINYFCHLLIHYVLSSRDYHFCYFVYYSKLVPINSIILIQFIIYKIVLNLLIYFYSKQCFCGNETPLMHDKAPESDCSKTCVGDSNYLCGGWYRNSIYITN